MYITDKSREAALLDAVESAVADADRRAAFFKKYGGYLENHYRTAGINWHEKVTAPVGQWKAWRDTVLAAAFPYIPAEIEDSEVWKIVKAFADGFKNFRDWAWMDKTCKTCGTKASDAYEDDCLRQFGVCPACRMASKND